MTSSLRAVAPLFFVSGAVALGCEAAYFRALTVMFGASHAAAGTLLAAFMGGLALGSEVGARLADRTPSPIRGYALSEAIVGGYAIAAPFLFALAYPLAETVGLPGRVALAFAILVVPTAAMGATLPFLAAACVPAREDLRRGLAALYTVNLAGAVLGALAVGFVLLPRLGFRRTCIALAGAALATALAALGVGRRRAFGARKEHVGPSLETDAPFERDSKASFEPLAPVIAAMVGLISFALQVAYNRVFALLLGSSAYTFALVVAVILAATGLGGARSARTVDTVPERRGTDPFWAQVSRRCLALALAVYLGTIVIYIAPFYMAWAAAHLTSMRGIRVGFVAVVVGIPSYQIGALFPALASRFPMTRVGRAAGRALLASTLGNIAGSLGAAFVAIPAFGIEQTLTGLSGAALVPALLAAHRAGRASFFGTSVAGVMALTLSIVLRPHWDAVALSAGSYRVRGYRDRASESDACAGSKFTENRVLFYRDGPVGSVVVLGHAGGPQCSLYSLRVNGKAEGSLFVAAPLESRVPAAAVRLPLGDLPSETLAGWLPAMAGPAPNDAMMVGWGTGISVHALLATGAGRVLAAELEPAVLDAAKLFDPELQHDRRVDVVVDDARMVLRRAPTASFDVIVSHPSNPWVVGASALFSREYFALARDRLRDGGRLMTWIQLYEMDREAARSLVATFLDAFPDAHAFRLSPSARDVFLIGLKSARPTSKEQLYTTFAARAGASEIAELRTAGLSSVEELMTRHMADGKDLLRYAEGATVDTDDQAALEYRIADHVLNGTGQEPAEIVRGLALPSHFLWRCERPHLQAASRARRSEMEQQLPANCRE